MAFAAASEPVAADTAAGAVPLCRHCGQPVPPQAAHAPDFCCRGCKAAFELINGLGLDRYYDRRCIDPDTRPLRPDEDVPQSDLSLYVQREEEGQAEALYLMVEGIHCAACVWLIENLLRQQPGVISARMNMTTRRLTLRWRGGEGIDPNALVEPVSRIGYRLVPYNPAALSRETEKHEKMLLRAMAVSGFASGNVMLLSVSVWAGVDMGVHTRDLFHYISALIAFPTVFYAIRPFWASAWAALRHGRTNMDVPIVIGIVITMLMSLWETTRSGDHAYFEASVMLLFFLLIGRYLDSRARGRARSAAEHLLALAAQPVMVLQPDGTTRMVPADQVSAGAQVIVAAGERIGIDGAIVDGRSDVDTSLITGESVPTTVAPGDRVFAGTLNLGAPLRLTVTAVGEGTLLSEIVRLMEVAEQGRARYMALADKVARGYSPVVHILALATFLGWTVLGGMAWQLALLIAVSVLIITCPCALALAVPVVQVVASGRLMRRGILVKSATALERLRQVDTLVFDKTGTLTIGRPELLPANGAWTDDALRLAAGLAGASRHPLSRALVRACPTAPVVDGVQEHPGQGLSATVPGVGEVRLGSRGFVGGAANRPSHDAGPEIWLATGEGKAPCRFSFSDTARSDAAETLATLKRQGLRVELLSGDREAAVRALAEALGIETWQAGCSPTDKTARLEALRAEGRVVAMVGDGLNDAPALAAAHVSLSPSTAVDISQTAADLVFQGEKLAPVIEALEVARKSDRLVRQNFALTFFYNIITIPVAVAGFVTPLLAAVAMSASSVVVIVNALRLARSGGNR